MHIQAGKYVLHEHRASASNWGESCIKSIMQKQNVEKVTGHMCRGHMTSKDEYGTGLVKKLTSCMTNSPKVAAELSVKCMGGHRHAHLMSGRAKNAQIYPNGQCLTILKGLKDELVADEKLRESEPLLQVCKEAELRNGIDLVDDGYDGIEYYDDVTGKPLDKNLVELARAEEMQVFREHEVYTEVPIQEAHDETGKQPIGVRWLDINKGDEVNTKKRNRLVAKEIKRDQRDDLFAATPPLEAKKALFSLAATAEFGRRKSKQLKGPRKLLFVDIRRAYFRAPATRKVYVQRPTEYASPGMCGRLNKSMYGTRDAASNWEECYTDFHVKVGFTP